MLFEFGAGVAGFSISVPAVTLRLVGGGVVLVLVLVGPPLAYRYVVRRFESYTLA